MKHIKLFENIKNLNLNIDNIYVISVYGFDFEEIFLTREDAEQALKTIAKNNNGDLVGREIYTLRDAIYNVIRSERVDY